MGGYGTNEVRCAVGTGLVIMAICLCCIDKVLVEPIAAADLTRLGTSVNYFGLQEHAPSRRGAPESSSIVGPGGEPTRLRRVKPLVDAVRIGGVSLPLVSAQQWVSEYTSVKIVSAANPYAYPAYDRYECERNDPRRLTDADLLAPGLLNVPVKIRSYYDLQRVRHVLEAGLANDDLDLALAEIDDPVRIAAMVKPLYGVLDLPQSKPWNVNATTLSKVLHRKRPKSLVLHDKWVNTCYVGTNGPVERVNRRSWADYMVAITLAIGNDIRTQLEAFKLLDEATSSPGELTHVRLLDILAWKSKGARPNEAAGTS